MNSSVLCERPVDPGHYFHLSLDEYISQLPPSNDQEAMMGDIYMTYIAGANSFNAGLSEEDFETVVNFINDDLGLGTADIDNLATAVQMIELLIENYKYVPLGLTHPVVTEDLVNRHKVITELLVSMTDNVEFEFGRLLLTDL